MESEIIKLGGVAIICCIAAYLLKKMRSDLSVGIGIVAAMIFFGYSLSLIEPFLSELPEHLRLGVENEYFSPVVKSLGVAFVVQIASGVCDTCGESGIADGIELVGRFEILFLCLPLIENIMECAIELISLE